MKKQYFHPITVIFPLQTGELMIPPVHRASDGSVTGPVNPKTGAPQRLGAMYV